MEIHETVGDENILLFGMTASQVEEVKRSGYNPMQHYQHDQQIRRALDALNQGIKGKNFHDIYRAIIQQDRYMALADFQSYRAAQDRAVALYHDKRLWNRMSLINIAGAGRFAADRAIRDYAGNIWHGSPVPPEKNLAAKMSL